MWVNLKRDVMQWCKECTDCQTSKVARLVKTSLEKRHLPADRFHSIHVDLVGPLPESEGMRYLLTAIDRFTRWPEAIPLPDIRTKTVVNALLRQWVARFGVPSDITADRGAQFTSTIWKEIHDVLGIKQMYTTSYHPQANGPVSYTHLTLPTIYSV